ncbi:MAG TPA: SusC/RagA family TonB-linked outer membrane protein [Agriterribacter sp.]|nr:SusC/RagA family TonB-linked outer membrane protein [Agriterribacter sp.]
MKRKPSFSKSCLGIMLPTIALMVVTTGSWAQDIAAISPSLMNKTNASSAGTDFKTVSLQDFMKEFKKIYENVYYSYQSNTLKFKQVSYDALDANKQLNPDIALRQVLTPAGLVFEKVNDVYVIKQSQDAKEENFVVATSMVNTTTEAADFAVRGKVNDNNGVGVPGVTVSEKGTSNVTSTNGDGDFALTVANSNATLVLSSVGFATQEVAVSGKSQLNIILQSTAQELEGVVVTALGISREKRSLGYSVGQVKGEEMTTVGNENMLTSLSGRVSGVTVNQTSGVGSSISVIIRGASSLGNNQPLYVVDGVPMGGGANTSDRGGVKADFGNGVADINPEDIENISVLKGPSAAALYGSRAGHGVILITTKSGKKGKGLGVSFSTSNVFETPYRYLDLHYLYANAEHNYEFDEYSSYWAGIPLDKGNTAVQWNSPLDANGDPIPTELKSYRDNMKNFLQTGITSNNDVSVAGSTEKSTYRVSYGNMTNQGLIPNSDLHRNSLSLAGTYNIGKSFVLSTNVNFVRSNAANRPQTAERNANPLQAVYNSSYVDVRELKGIWKPGLEQIEQLSPAPGEFDNPYFIAYGITSGFVRNRMFGNVKLDWNIMPGLTAFARITHDVSNENRETKIAWSYTGADKGGYYLDDYSGSETNADFLVTYTKKVSDFDFSVSGGGNYRLGKGGALSVGGQGLSIPGLYNISNIPVGNLSRGSSKSKKLVYSLYGMASIGFKNQVYLDITGRNDWSSTLPEENRSYFYPSASLSWLANKTFTLPSQISLLKLRAGWAQVGNDTDPYGLTANLSPGSWGNIITTGVSGVQLNPQLKPEIATSTEGGIDLNMFKNRLRFDFTYYNIENVNQILDITIPSSSGFDRKRINAGKLVSTGWEMGIGGTPIQGKNWTLDLNVNVSRNRVTLEEYIPGAEEANNFYTQWSENGGGAYTFVGEQIGNMYSRGYAQVEDPNSPYYRWPIIEWDGTNGGQQWQELDGKENAVKVGNYNPDFLAGIAATLTYKRFALNLLFDWRSGGDFMSFTYRYGESDWKGQRQIDNLIPGGNYSKDELVDLLKSDPGKYIIPQNGNFPRVGGHTAETGGMGPDGEGAFVPGVWQDADGNFHEWLGGDGTEVQYITNVYPWGFNQQVTFDASFIKLREISLSYKVPNFLNVVRDATFSVYMRNLMLWNAADIGIDPERAYWIDGSKSGGFRQGIERQNVMPWTIPFGFKLNFNL